MARVQFVHTLLRAQRFQERPELNRLLDWWRSGGTGVCSLVGMGGAGKTALADRFLRMLAGVVAGETPEQPRNAPAAPGAVFVFSFYEAANPQTFFAHLHAWAIGEPYDDRAPHPSYTRTLATFQKALAARSAASTLLVLDGLERVQDDSLRGGVLGRLSDTNLRDFVERLALGILPGVGAIVTTRFPLADLDEQDLPHHHTIPVDKLTPEASVALLRERGVHGSDAELHQVAEECGHHALSIDLAGGYIREFCAGESCHRPEPGSTLDLQARIADEPNPRKRAVLWQEHRLSRIAERYRDVLTARDPAALAVLQRVCIFRLRVSAEMIDSVFLGASKQSISGPALAALTPKQVRARLTLLVQLGLLERSPEGYGVHPAVRDSFLRSLDHSTMKSGHEAVRRNFQAQLDGHPGGLRLGAPALFDCIEEIIYHTQAAGHIQEAWGIYWNRTGRHAHLARRLGMAERGRRICQSFLDEHGRPLLENRFAQAYLFNNLALYCRDLGLLESAIKFFAEGLRIRKELDDPDLVAMGLRNLSHVLYLAGNIEGAMENARAALGICGLSADDQTLGGALLARGHLLRGESELFTELVARTRGTARPRDAAGQLLFYPDLWEAEAHLRAANPERAKILIDNALRDAVSHEYESDRMRLVVLHAEVLRQQGAAEDALDHLYEPREWSVTHEQQSLRCEVAAGCGRALLDLSRRHGESGDKRRVEECQQEARVTIESGLQSARDCGYGLIYIDLMVLRARLHLLLKDREAAISDAYTARYGAKWSGDRRLPLDETALPMTRGIYRRKTSTTPEILAATHPACQYRWGDDAATQVLAAAHVLPKINPRPVGILGAVQSESAAPIRLFCIHAPADEAFLVRLEAHLANDVHQGKVTFWSRLNIVAGDNIGAQIEHHLKVSELVLPLVSADLFASPECIRLIELALERQKTILPILVRAVAWQGNLLLGHLAALPRDGQPVNNWKEAENAWVDVVKGIWRAALRQRELR